MNKMNIMKIKIEWKMKPKTNLFRLKISIEIEFKCSKKGLCRKEKRDSLLKFLKNK